MALWGVCLNEIALVLLCVAMLLVQKTRVTLSTIGYKTKVEVITTWSPASTRASVNLVGFVFLALQNNPFLLIGHFFICKSPFSFGIWRLFQFVAFQTFRDRIHSSLHSEQRGKWIIQSPSSIYVRGWDSEEWPANHSGVTLKGQIKRRTDLFETYISFHNACCIAGKTETYLTGKVGRTFVSRECHMNYLKPKISEEGRYSNDVWALTL